MPTNIIDITNFITNTTTNTNFITETNSITSWSDPALLVTMIGSVLTFLITCFIAITGWKAYGVYQEQVYQSKIDTMINLHNENLKIHNELMDKDKDDNDALTRYRFKLHNIYNSICAFFIHSISPKDKKLIEIFHRLFYSSIYEFISKDYEQMLNDLSIDQDKLPLALSIQEYCDIWDIKIQTTNNKDTNK